MAQAADDEAGAGPAGVANRTEQLAFARDIAKLVLEALLIVLILYCLARPDVVRSWLGQLGISKLSVLGLELSPANEQEIARTIQGLTQERDQARDEVRLLREQAGQVYRQLETLRGAQPAQSAEARRVDTLIAQVRPVATAPTPPSSPAPTAVQRTLIQGARESIGGNGQWAVVFGADRQIEAARYEIRRAGLPTARPVLRQGYYRSVAFADSAEGAAVMLEAVRGQRPEAYIVNFLTWCPRKESGEGFDRCL